MRTLDQYVIRPPGTAGQSRGTAIDLFSGAGGITLGLLNAGFEVLLSADISAPCRDTHACNLASVPFYHGDMRQLSVRDIRLSTGLSRGELDLLIGGPPCQGFSIIGARDPRDPRNGLFHDFLRIADGLAPKAIVIENVPGLATLQRGRFLEDLGKAFDAAGYSACCAELLSAQYGVPQLRWRMFFIGWRHDLDIAVGGFPKPTHGTLGIGALVPNRTITSFDSSGFLTTREAISDLPQVYSGGVCHEYSGPPSGPYQLAMRDSLTGELYNHYAPRMSAVNLERIRYLSPGQDWRDLPTELLPESMRRALRKDHTRRFRRMEWGGVPRSIITRFRDPKSGEYIHPEQDRTISIREAARIQSFPDWFEFRGSYTDQYEQIGNAVPPILAREVCAEVLAVLNGDREVDRATPRSRYSISAARQPGLFADPE